MEGEGFTKKLDVFKTLYDIGINLASEKDTQKLLEKILDSAIALSKSDGGTIYTLKDNSLIFKVSKNNVLRQMFVQDSLVDILGIKKIPLTENTLSGYVALKKEILIFGDSKSAHNMGFTFDQTVFSEIDYSVESSLTMPLLTGDSTLVGVLQLVNRRENGEIIPYDKETIDLMKFFASQAAVAIQNANLIEEIKEIQLEAIYMLSTAAEFKDKVTGDHIKRISRVSYLISRKMHFDREFCEIILYASPMHDIGKVVIPDQVLNKPDRLEPKEWKIMKKHTIYGAQIIGDSKHKLFQVAKNIALYHHERFDGTGYPYGLSGDEIPIEARIVQVADVFDALVSERPYKTAWTFDDALEYIQDMRGTQFDPEVANSFVELQETIFKLYNNK